MNLVDGHNEERMNLQMQQFHSTLTMIHAQIGSVNDRLDARDAGRSTGMAPAQPPPPVVSHRGFGSLPPRAAAPAQTAQAVSPSSGEPGDPVSYDADRQQWAAQTLKAMREQRN